MSGRRPAIVPAALPRPVLLGYCAYVVTGHLRELAVAQLFTPRTLGTPSIGRPVKADPSARASRGTGPHASPSRRRLQQAI
jgi:hypothetical protein